MKVSDIILEAPQTKSSGKSSGGQKAFSQMTTQLSASSKGLMSNVNGTPTSTSPTNALKTFASDKVAAAQSASKSMWSKFTSSKIFRFFGNKYLGPFVIWLDDMSSINMLFDAGAFNDHGNKAGEVTQQLRTYYTQLLISRMATMWVAWGAASFATGAAVRGLVALIPGLGWLANLAAAVAQVAVYALLNTETVQKYLTFKILENLVPEWINDPIYGFARVFGAVGSTVPAYITQLKRKYIGNGDEKSADASQTKPSTSSAPKAEPKGQPSPAADDDGISGADLAKKLF
jgi:hypothetical protein